MLYAIGDLHLSLATDKSMEVFGRSWEGYVEKIRRGFAALTPEDTCVLCGDATWGMTLPECLEDFRFLNALPGRKLLLKGNHDYWWSTAAKARRFFLENGLDTLEVLHNNSYLVDGVAVCGTRGWFCEETVKTGHDRKILDREVQRLELSLAAAPEGAERVVFLHYPPLYKGYRCPEMLEVLRRHGVRRCYYGHIHGPGHAWAVQGEAEGIRFRMVSADYLGFLPVRVSGTCVLTNDFQHL